MMSTMVDNMEPPPGYFVLASPNDGENGTYACPDDGCDGVVCGSIQDCHMHNKEWHSPPYTCAECEANFASDPALSRHAKATGHPRWICQRDGCELRGVEFESHLTYRAHTTKSAAHRRPGHVEEDCRDVRCLADGLGELYDDDDDADMSDDALSDCPDTEEFKCLERCCSQYLRDHATKRMWDVHGNSLGHKCAVQEGISLLQQALPMADLEAKQEALREFRCDVTGCAQFGNRLAASRSFYNHIKSRGHLSPQRASEDTDDEDGETGTRLSCLELGCRQHGRRFASEDNYQRHVKTAAHVKAVGRNLTYDMRKTRTSPRNKALLPVAKSEPDEATCTSTDGTMSHASATTPRSAGSLRTILSSPLSTMREEYLERKNGELERELRRLQLRMC